MDTPRGHSRRKLGIVLFFLGGSASLRMFTQDATSSQNPQIDADRLAQAVFHNEIDAQIHDQSLWSYRELKEDNGKQELFVVCQTNGGEIGRLLAVNGQELSPDQRQAEAQRIHKMLNQPSQMRRKQKEQHQDALQAQHLMEMFPAAFRFQYDGMQGSLIRLKFTSNPNFHASSRAEQVFHHVEGRLLVDNRQNRLAEISGQLTSEVKFFGGLLGHLDKGGTFLVRQQDMGSGHWELTLMDIEMNGKAVFFKTIAVREREVDSNFRRVPDGTTLQQALTFLQSDPSVQISMRSTLYFEPSQLNASTRPVGQK
jgi:hypothetical protein